MSVDFQKLQEDVSDIREMLLSMKGVNSSPSISPIDEVLTIQQAADFLSLTTQTVYGLVAGRKIPFSKPTGSRLYFSRLELIEWLKAHRTATVQEQVQQFDQDGLARRRSANSKARKAA